LRVIGVEQETDLVSPHRENATPVLRRELAAEEALPDVV
jgi:hypothetical protein